MRLAQVDIRDYRSIFSNSTRSALTLELGIGMNTLIGSNNCGKSNILRAISLAFDPEHRFDPQRDAPGPRPFAFPIITLRFVAGDNLAPESDVLAAAAEYEAGLGIDPAQSRASNGEIILEVAFQPGSKGYRRRERLLVANERTPSNSEDNARLESAVSMLRDAVRFVLIRSGESLESVLEGNFREILHSVVREHLSEEFTRAEASRKQYITGLQDELLSPLRKKLGADVAGLFPEIERTQLTPEVPSIERTLSNVGVSLGDLVDTPLEQKGTGVRGAVLAALLSYLGRSATRSMVFAFEEPEAFLHPASQEDLRDLLEELALTSDTTLLVSTHSPYIATRAPQGRLFSLAKDPDGRTRVARSVPGDAPHASLIGGLFRESSLEEFVARDSSLPAGTKAVLLVEGAGDEFCLKLAAEIVGRPELLDDIQIRPTGGTNKMAVQSILARAGSDVPVFVLVDNDDAGKATVKLLCDQKFRFQKGREVTTYAEVFPKKQREFPYEAEDLFAPDLLEAFVASHEPPIHDGSKKRPDGAFHYDFGQAAKSELKEYLRVETRPRHVERWIDLILMLRERLKLPGIEQSAVQLTEAAEAALEDQSPTQGGSVLILAEALQHAHHYSQYSASAALTLDVDQELPADLTRIGFYVNAAIQPTFPRVLARYPALHYRTPTARQLRATGNTLDARAAGIIEQSVKVDDERAGKTHQLLLLSEMSSADTFVLDQPIENTKKRAGRRLAWAVSPKVIAWSSIAASPTTTDDLDRLEATGGKNNRRTNA